MKTRNWHSSIKVSLFLPEFNGTLTFDYRGDERLVKMTEATGKVKISDRVPGDLDVRMKVNQHRGRKEIHLCQVGLSFSEGKVKEGERYSFCLWSSVLRNSRRDASVISIMTRGNLKILIASYFT